MSINLRELVTLILMMIYMRFPREQKSQHRLIFKDLNEAKMTKSSSSEASFNDNPKIFCSQLMILLCSCFDQNFELIYSVLYTSVEAWRKSEKREAMQNFLICVLSIWERNPFFEAGEFIRQVKLIVFLLIPNHKSGYGLQRVTNHNTPE